MVVHSTQSSLSCAPQVCEGNVAGRWLQRPIGPMKKAGIFEWQGDSLTKLQSEKPHDQSFPEAQAAAGRAPVKGR